MNAITQELAAALAYDWTRDNPESDALRIPELCAELRANFQARLADPASQPVGTPLTPAQMQAWDEKSLNAYWGQL